jgi:hypothetical protein
MTILVKYCLELFGRGWRWDGKGGNGVIIRKRRPKKFFTL